MSTIKTKAAEFTFNPSDRIGKPSEELFKSVTVVPLNNQGEYHVLSFSDGFPLLRGWMNAVRDHLLLDEYQMFANNLVHLYRPNNPDRIAGEMGWVNRRALSGTVRGTPYSRLQLNGDLVNVKLPTWRDEAQVAQVDIRGDWMFLKQRFQGEYALSNPSIDDYSGECFASIKHNAILELVRGVAVTIPCTIKVRADGTLGQGLHNKAAQMYKELQLLESEAVDQAELRKQNYAIKMAFRNEQTVDTKIDAETEYNESLPEDEQPEPEPVSKTVVVDGKKTALKDIRGLYKVWPVASGGGRMRRPEVPFIRFSGENDVRLHRYAKDSYELESLS